MGTFADIHKGGRARTQVEIRFVGMDEPTKIDLRVLRSDEEAEVLSKALAFAKAKGSENPVEGDQLYDLGLWAYTVLAACLDPDSAEESMFFGSVEELLSTDLITPDHLAFLYELQEQWQAQNSPYERTMSDEELLTRAARVAMGEIRPFLELRPGIRWNFVRSMACRLYSSQEPKSSIGGPSAQSLKPSKGGEP